MSHPSLSGAITLIQEEWAFEEWQTELVVASLNAFAIPGAFIAGYTSDTFGRTKTLAAASIFFIVGMTMMTFSEGFYSLLFGRVLCGLGLGCGVSIDPLYIAEIAPPQYRGMLVSFSETSINIGILLGFVSVFVFNAAFEPQKAWRVMLFCGVPTPVISEFHPRVAPAITYTFNLVIS